MSTNSQTTQNKSKSSTNLYTVCPLLLFAAFITITSLLSLFSILPWHLFITISFPRPQFFPVWPLEDHTESSYFEARWLIVFLSFHQGFSDSASHHRAKLWQNIHPARATSLTPGAPMFLSQNAGALYCSSNKYRTWTLWCSLREGKDAEGWSKRWRGLRRRRKGECRRSYI